MTFAFRNPVYSSADGQQINMEINHPAHGWIPFTASPEDVEELGRALYAEALLEEVGEYIRPVPAPPDAKSEISVEKFSDAFASLGMSKKQIDALWVKITA